MLEYEIHFVMNRLRLIKNNESAWNYLRGILQNGDMDQMKKAIAFAEELSEDGEQYNHILAFIFDASEEVFLNETSTEQLDMYREKAMTTSVALQTKYDIIRTKYWKYRELKFESKVAQKNLNVEDA